MKHALLVIFTSFCLVWLLSASESFAQTEAAVSSDLLARGGIIMLTVKSDVAQKPRAIWMEKEIPLVYIPTNAAWSGFVGADLNHKTGVYELFVQLPESGMEKKFKIRVIAKDYGARRLRLPPKKVELSAAALKRVKKEQAAVGALWRGDCAEPLWDDRFIMPGEGKMIGFFGQRSIINNQERSPHSGVDLRGKIGDPVRAMHRGYVVLAADHFFTGKSLYLDHGGCIISMYFHLDKILVNEGDRIEKGQLIGLIGATGRVTGPHLHWGVRVNQARVNPLDLINLGNLWEN